MKLRSITDRVRYLGALARPSTWRWILARIDFAFEERIFQLNRVTVGKRCWIHPTVRMRHGENIRLGNDTRVQANSLLWAAPNAGIEIGDHSGIGPGTMMFASNHTFQPGVPYHKQPWQEATIRIGSDVWIGAGCIVLAGVNVGDGSVVAAGSVITKDIPPGSVAAGVPAKVLRARAIESS